MITQIAVTKARGPVAQFQFAGLKPDEFAIRADGADFDERVGQVGAVCAGVGRQAATDRAGNAGSPLEAGESGARGRAGERGESHAGVDLDLVIVQPPAAAGLVLDHHTADAAVADQHV